MLRGPCEKTKKGEGYADPQSLSLCTQHGHSCLKENTKHAAKQLLKAMQGKP